MMLNAVVCVWNEEDIIEATVRHAFAQGCSNVYLIDNDSADNTVANAVRAGAKHVASFKTEYFDVHKKTAHLNAAVKYFNELSQERHMWWMYLDADEFPNIDSNMRVIDLLNGLDASVRGLHGHMLDHIPTHPPYAAPSHHPADLMPLCRKTSAEKILLLRYDKGEPHLYSACGAHTLDTCGKMLPVARNIINIHHFPMRNPAYTLNRLKKLVTKNHDGTSRVDRHDYMATLEGGPKKQSQYRDRYDGIVETYRQNKDAALQTSGLMYNFKCITRWYKAYEEQALENVEPYDKFMASAIHHFFMKEYDIAVRNFYDALQLCTEENTKILITSKISECLSVSEPDDFKKDDDKKSSEGKSGDIPLQLDIQQYFGRYDVA